MGMRRCGRRFALSFALAAFCPRARLRRVCATGWPCGYPPGTVCVRSVSVRARVGSRPPVRHPSPALTPPPSLPPSSPHPSEPYVSTAPGDPATRRPGDARAGAASPRSRDSRKWCYEGCSKGATQGSGGCGKSSIQKVVFHKMSPHETLFLEGTSKIVKTDINNSAFLRFEVWDLPPPTLADFTEQAAKWTPVFSGCSSLVWVIDVQRWRRASARARVMAAAGGGGLAEQAHVFPHFQNFKGRLAPEVA
ncbi:Gtr1/RagA G protein conserved region-domain-containing protein [Pavlovales sp. CCMP2436]|nr:Gtr1/RagA G protein conserved region-domain-containing protein [Pavlovales sp. CCMP2436]